MTAERTIFLATSNPAKVRKLAWLLDGLGYVVDTRGEDPCIEEPEEGEGTHREIAARKALFWSEHSGHRAIASDGGARIPSLGERWSSTRTRRAAGADADDRDRAEHLLGLMRGKKGAARDVVWVEGLSLADRGELLASWQVECNLGRLATTYDPSLLGSGFWMGALLYVARFNKVYARLSPSELAQVDDCWNELRRRVRAYLA